MSKLFIPILILLWSFLYSWFWNCGCGNYQRRQLCPGNAQEAYQSAAATDTTMAGPAAPVTAQEKLLFTPLDIQFQSGSSNIIFTDSLKNFLSNAKSYLAENPERKLSLTGYTDNTGSAEGNIKLSKQRADKVKEILVKDGFSPTNIETFGKGAADPVGDNNTEAGKAQNRRVSIRLMN